jgi:hypothetical protein
MLVLRRAQFIDKVFIACIELAKADGTFTAKAVVARVAPPGLEGDDSYYADQNVSASIRILEHMRLMSGQTRPEYTPSLRLLMEVRHGHSTRLGATVSRLPAYLRYLLLVVYIQRKRVTSILGVLAFVRLLSNAYQGAALLGGWIEYVAALMLLYILYLVIKKAIG